MTGGTVSKFLITTVSLQGIYHDAGTIPNYVEWISRKYQHCHTMNEDDSTTYPTHTLSPLPHRAEIARLGK